MEEHNGPDIDDEAPEFTVDIVEPQRGNAIEGVVVGCGILAAAYAVGYVALHVFGVL